MRMIAALGGIVLLVLQQSGTGIVAGRVEDLNGGALPGVTISLERDGTVRKTTSNANGRYSIADVLPGTNAPAICCAT